ncbi:MAG: hypothetical protein LBS76_05205 [Mycoplasmataceae bacterium]|nr:hypothetical protein [Mycoplasmataceae bacterium]
MAITMLIVMIKFKQNEKKYKNKKITKKQWNKNHKKIEKIIEFWAKPFSSFKKKPKNDN